MRKIYIGIILVLITVAGFSCKQRKVVAFNFPVGTTFSYSIENHQKTLVLGDSLDYQMKVEGTYTRHLNSESLETLIKRVKVDYQSGGIRRVFDSELKDNPTESESAIAGIFDLVNQRFDLQIGTQNGLYGLDFPGIENNREDSFLIFQLFSPFFDFYPGKPVKTGQQWTSSREMMIQNLTGHLETTFTLEAIRQDTAIIATKASLNLPPQEIIRNKMKLKVSMNGKQNGKLSVLISQGRLIYALLNTRTQTTYQTNGLETKSLIEGTTTLTSQKEL